MANFNDDVPIDAMHECYQIHQYDRNSLEEVQKCINSNYYKNKAQIDEHIEFISDLQNKMNHIIKLESQFNHSVENFIAFLSDIKIVHNQLINMRRSFETSDTLGFKKEAEKKKNSGRTTSVSSFKT